MSLGQESGFPRPPDRRGRGVSLDTGNDLASLAGRLTCTVPEAGQLLGIGRDAAERGELPCLRLDRRLVVPIPRLLDLLGATGPPHDPTKKSGGAR